MKEDMPRYEQFEDLEDRADEIKEYLIQMKERYTQREGFMKPEAKKLSTQYEENTILLKRSETWQSLERFEDKLCRQGQVVHSLKEFVSKKGRQTDYDNVKNECIGIAEELNELIISSQ